MQLNITTEDAFGFISQAMTDFAKTLAPSVQGPFAATSNLALQHLRGKLGAADGATKPESQP
jgi:hypothetical protein